MAYAKGPSRLQSRPNRGMQATDTHRVRLQVRHMQAAGHAALVRYGLGRDDEAKTGATPKPLRLVREGSGRGGVAPVLASTFAAVVARGVGGGKSLTGDGLW